MVAGDPLDPAINYRAQHAAEAVDGRVTIILADGTVIGESERPIEGMENHLGRPEVQAALDNKEAVRIRYSNTLGEDLLYAAVPVIWDRRPDRGCAPGIPAGQPAGDDQPPGGFACPGDRGRRRPGGDPGGLDCRLHPAPAAVAFGLGRTDRSRPAARNRRPARDGRDQPAAGDFPRDGHASCASASTNCAPSGANSKRF